MAREGSSSDREREGYEEQMQELFKDKGSRYRSALFTPRVGISRPDRQTRLASDHGRLLTGGGLADSSCSWLAWLDWAFISSRDFLLLSAATSAEGLSRGLPATGAAMLRLTIESGHPSSTSTACALSESVCVSCVSCVCSAFEDQTPWNQEKEERERVSDEDHQMQGGPELTQEVLRRQEPTTERATTPV